MLTKEEIDAIRFYQGDIRKRVESVSFSENEKEEGFWGIPSAYRTMNCLMFDGIDNEKERIAEGTANLNPEVFLEIDKVADVFFNIFRAMCKNSKVDEKGKNIRTLYRTDRRISVQEMKRQGRTISLTSASKDNCFKEYFQKKKQLTLLEIVVSPGIPCLDFEEIFGNDYYFMDQKEILLPPFLCANFYEGKLTKEEEKYRDADGLPPQGKYIVMLEKIVLPERKSSMQESHVRLHELKGNGKKMAELLENLIKGKELTEEEIKEYCAWKKEFQEIIIEGFRVIQNEGIGTENFFQNRKNCLTEDIMKMIREYDDCRRRYKKYMRTGSFLLAIASIAPLVCMALSFVQNFEACMKIIAILISSGALFLTRILKTEAYHLKLYQRTKTCLSLRDLLRQIKYEHCWSEEKLEEYIGVFRAIMKDDTDMSLQNLQLQIDYEGELFQDEIISF